MARGQKTGGRRKGTPNKATADIKAAFRKHGQEFVRALRKLADAGVIVDMGRKWHHGRRYYMLHAAADRYSRWIKEIRQTA